MIRFPISPNVAADLVPLFREGLKASRVKAGEFAAVVEARGFSEAARRLRLSKSMVSKQVTRLEKNVGARLLHRLGYLPALVIATVDQLPELAIETAQ